MESETSSANLREDEAFFTKNKEIAKYYTDEMIGLRDVCCCKFVICHGGDFKRKSSRKVRENILKTNFSIR